MSLNTEEYKSMTLQEQGEHLREIQFENMCKHELDQSIIKIILFCHRKKFANWNVYDYGKGIEAVLKEPFLQFEKDTVINLKVDKGQITIVNFSIESHINGVEEELPEYKYTIDCVLYKN